MGLFEWLLGPPSRDRFARQAMNAIAGTGEQRPMHYRRADFAIAIGDPVTNVVWLGNFYDEMVAVPRARRDDVLQRVAGQARMVPEIARELDQARAHILPRIRRRRYYEELPVLLQLQGPAMPSGTIEDQLPVYRPFAEHLGLGIAYDLPQNILWPSKLNLSNWGLTLDETFEIGLANLRARSGGAFEQLAQGLFRSPWRDNYDPSRLLLTDLFTSLPLRGLPLAVVPDRDTILVTGSDDFVGQASIAVLVEEGADGPRQESTMPFVFRDGSWRPAVGEANVRLLPALGKLHLRELWDAYGSQKEQLVALIERRREELFVASYMIYEKPQTGQMFSACVWTEGVRSLLPRATMVSFVRPQVKSVVAQTSWERAIEVVGRLMRRQDGYPERFLVEAFPSDAQLAELRESEDPLGPFRL